MFSSHRFRQSFAALCPAFILLHLHFTLHQIRTRSARVIPLSRVLLIAEFKLYFLSTHECTSINEPSNTNVPKRLPRMPSPVPLSECSLHSVSTLPLPRTPSPVPLSKCSLHSVSTLPSVLSLQLPPPHCPSAYGLPCFLSYRGGSVTHMVWICRMIPCGRLDAAFEYH
jgi:hypothetical protein